MANHCIDRFCKKCGHEYCLRCECGHCPECGVAYNDVIKKSTTAPIKENRSTTSIQRYNNSSIQWHITKEIITKR